MVNKEMKAPSALPVGLQIRKEVILHRPTQGWTVGEYILHWQSKLASSTVQPWVGRWRITSFLIWECTESAEEAFISLFANWLPLYTCLDIIIDERIWRAILELVAVVTRVVNIMNGEVLEAAVEELDGLAHSAYYVDAKR